MAPITFERGGESSTLTSSKKSEFDLWNTVKLGWEWIFGAAQSLLSLFFCRPFCWAEQSVDFGQFQLDCLRIMSGTTVDEKIEIFERLPSKFQKRVLSHFSALSDNKSKVTSFEQVVNHDKFGEGFMALSERFFFVGVCSHLGTVLKRISKNPRDNLPLFNETCGAVQQKIAEKMETVDKRTTQQKIQMIQDKPKQHLSKPNFTTWVQEVRKDGQTKITEAEETLKAQKLLYES